MPDTPLVLNPLTFPLHGTRLIEASAGTGKTYTLAALFVRLVLGHGDEAHRASRPLLPPEILVVTFTNAATAELRNRIRQRLVEVATAFRSPTPPDPLSDRFLADLYSSYPVSDHPRCAAALDLAAQWMDEAAIFTIHGWCQRMLTEHAFDSGAAFGETMAEEQQQLLEEVARDYWRHFIYPIPAAVMPLLTAALGQSPTELLQKKIKTLLKLHQQQQPFQLKVGTDPAPEPQEPADFVPQLDQWQQQRQRLWEQLQSHLASGVAYLQQAYDEKQMHGNHFRINSWPSERAELSSWQRYRSYPSDSPQLNIEKLVEKYRQNKLDTHAKKGARPLKHPLFAACQPLFDHLHNLPNFTFAVQRHAVCWIAAEFQRLKQRDRLLDFNDLLVRLHTALHAETGAVLARRIRQQFPLAMVDEFQDTDPIQFEILQRIYFTSPPSNTTSVESNPNPTDADPCGVILVGDPKQAIYSFRGADIYTYLKARAITTRSHFNLTVNYRSTAAYVTAVNRLFTQAEERLLAGAFQFATATENPLPFIESTAQGRSKQLLLNQQPAAPLYTTVLPSPLNKGQYLSQSAEQTARQILQLLHQGQRGESGFLTPDGHFTPVTAADIAILVRNRTEADTVRQALYRYGVRSVYLSERESIFKSEEAPFLQAWLTACAEPEAEGQLRTALIQPLSMQSDLELDRQINDERAWEQLTEQLHRWQQVWQQQGVLPMVRLWLQYFHLPARWQSDPRFGERTLTNLLHLAERLQQESPQHETPRSLLRWLTEQMQNPSQNEEYQLRLESDDHLIQVVTLHKAKGLQYPLVFLPFIADHRPAKDKEGLYYHDQEQSVLNLKPDQAAKTLAEIAQLQEEIRLLYVGLTRAMYACWLGLAAFSRGNGSHSAIDQSAIGTLLALPAQPTDDNLLAALEPLQSAGWQRLPLLEREPSYWKPTTEMALQPARQLTTRFLFPPWWIASYSALTALGLESPHSHHTDWQRDYLEDEPEARSPRPPTTPPSIHTFPRGAEAGSFLHELLEWGCATGFSAWQLTQPELATELKRRLDLQSWGEWQAALTDWSALITTTPLQTQTQATLATLPQIVSELEFWIEVKRVDIQQLDWLIQRYIWPDQPRPALRSNILNGMLKGYIDLTFQTAAGRYWVLDYKSNTLGEEESHYTPAAMVAEMLKHRYDLQASLYLLALHRLLKARELTYRDNPTQPLIGGALYWFIRAPATGQITLTPPVAFLEQLDRLFRGETL